ncbi:hypothetical protein BJF78_28435 [Pseudonocardia sp. CNS-139]|nr:hypothetical protein BJF78_28435 [Pseudonocardia sp. CNS-139]
MDTSGPGELLGKRTLVELSRMVERFALAAPPDEPLVVLALFQKQSYFAHESARYGELAARGAVTVVGVAEDTPPPVPPGVRTALLPAADALAREWSVTVLGPRAGATLVATDLERVDPLARTLEGGRTFHGAWSFRREDAYEQVLRLRTTLRLTADVRDEIDGVLRTVRRAPEPVDQDWWTEPMRYLADRLGAMLHRQTAAALRLDVLTEQSADRDPRTGLHTERFLDRWTRGLGAGTLPIGLALLRVHGLADVRSRYGLRAELAALRGVAASVQDLLTPVDRVVRTGRDDFLVVLPSWAPERVLWFCEEVCRRVAGLDAVYPFVSLPGVAAATVTRNRPLPVDRLREQLAASGDPTVPVTVLDV